MLHINPSKVEACGFQQGQYCGIVDKVHPCPNLQFTPLDTGAQWIGLHSFHSVCRIESLCLLRLLVDQAGGVSA